MFNIEQDSYQSFRNIIAERTNRVVAWVGAGLGRPSDLPSWSDLRNRLCSVLNSKLDTLKTEEPEKLRKISRTAQEHSNLWAAFEMLEEVMGSTTYRSTVVEALEVADTCRIPENYKSLWLLPIKGIINLNLDGLAVRAHSCVLPGDPLRLFNGKDAGKFLHVLKEPHPFVAHLHGIVHNTASWVFTSTSLRQLFATNGYQKFVKTCIAGNTLLFLGITADDIAVKTHLVQMKKQGVDFGTHYWITDRTDKQTDTWAESVGLRVIRYHSINGDHSELKQLFADLVQYVSKDTEAPPATPSVYVQKPLTLPSPSEILSLPDEEVRQLLNAQASLILQEHSEEAHAKYEEFCKNYDKAIHRSWYATADEPNNTLLEYVLKEEIAEGAFGRVFRAQSPGNEEVAVKLLRPDVRRNPHMLQSFRRGVQAMSILSKHNVKGMVPYQRTFEIPALVIMDFINGPNLAEAVEADEFREWSDVMRVAVDLAHIIRDAHMLPERVLHRDIRPPNIMLQNYYTDPENWDVVVLDFDLCWYRDAVGLSVSNSSTVTGYLAPEQLGSPHVASTRNALVDSYGLGMTLFFLRTGQEPNFHQHKYADWQNVLTKSICRHLCRNWHSLPRRFARLIEYSTRDKQSERWDLSMMEGELERLQEAETDPSSVRSAELWAEEVASRAVTSLGSHAPYQWNPNTSTATVKLVRGVRILVKACESKDRVEATIAWAGTGDEDYRRIKKYMPAKCEKAVSILKKGRWQIQGKINHTSASALCTSSIAVPLLQSGLDNAAAMLSSAITEMRFE